MLSNFRLPFATAKPRAASLPPAQVASRQGEIAPEPELEPEPATGPNAAPSRLETLRAHGILDTPPEAAFDRVTEMAAWLFGMPVALLTLLDRDREWFKSARGLEMSQVPREAAFGAHFLDSDSKAVLVVPDARLDARFAGSPLVAGAPNARFYAGAPFCDGNGQVLGALCILDFKPREFGAEAQRTLEQLAQFASSELELRRLTRENEAHLLAREAAESAETLCKSRFERVFEMPGLGIGMAALDGKWLQSNDALCEMLGYSDAELRGRTFCDVTHADDWPGEKRLIDRLLAGEIASFDLEKRYVHRDGHILWTQTAVALVRDAQNAPLHFVGQIQDVSGFKQASEDLRVSRARQSAFADAALDAMITLNGAGRVVEWNRAAETIFGYARENAVGAALRDLIVPRDLREPHIAGWEKILDLDAGTPGQRAELPTVRANGKRLVTEIAVVAIEGTSPALWVAQARDISARRRAEERLRLLESVAVHANDAILITEAEPFDLPGPRILYSNEAYHRMTGYTADDLIGQTPRISQGPGTSPESREAIRRGLRRWKPFIVELLNKKKDGTPFWVELSLVPVADETGWFTHWVSIQRDVTERRRITDALRESESRYGRIAANVPGMVYQFVLELDGSFRFPFVSEGCREIYGLEPEQIMADAMLVTNYIHPDDQKTFFSSIEGSAQSLEAWEWEGRVAVPEQGQKWIRGTSRPKREENGEIIWDGILFDISARKKQEDALQSTKIEAEIAREEAERANVAKSEFLSRMSHELRTPLNAILGFGQLLEMAELPEEDLESAEQIVGAGRHLLGLINEVLDIARIESGNISLSPEPVRVAEIGLEALDLVRPLAAARGLVLDDSAIRACQNWVRADRQGLKQILLNLLSNAVKYNRAGGRLTLSCVATEAGRIRLGVRDSGTGIAPALRERLFTAFDRLGAENTDIEGTGVGLALSRRLAEAMDGTLDLESFDAAHPNGPGCLFWVELPRADDPVDGMETLGAAPETPAVVNTKLVVLYIEDNPSNLQLVQKLLAHRPEIRLLTAIHGEMGLELARGHCPDLILLDMNLPDVSGPEVLKMLRSGAQTCSIPVVIVSADATTRQIAHMMEAGAQQYLTKPFNVRELLAILDGSIAKNEIERAPQPVLALAGETP